MGEAEGHMGEAKDNIEKKIRKSGRKCGRV